MEETTGEQIAIQYKGWFLKMIVPVVNDGINFVESRQLPATGTFELSQAGFKHQKRLVKDFLRSLSTLKYCL